MNTTEIENLNKSRDALKASGKLAREILETGTLLTPENVKSVIGKKIIFTARCDDANALKASEGVILEIRGTRLVIKEKASAELKLSRFWNGKEEFEQNFVCLSNWNEGKPMYALGDADRGVFFEIVKKQN